MAGPLYGSRLALPNCESGLSVAINPSRRPSANIGFRLMNEPRGLLPRSWPRWRATRLHRRTVESAPPPPPPHEGFSTRGVLRTRDRAAPGAGVAPSRCARAARGRDRPVSASGRCISVVHRVPCTTGVIRCRTDPTPTRYRTDPIPCRPVTGRAGSGCPAGDLVGASLPPRAGRESSPSLPAVCDGC